MRYCVTCHISNHKIKFIETQCPECFAKKPIRHIPYSPPPKKCKCGETISRASKFNTCKICRRLEKVKSELCNPAVFNPISFKASKYKVNIRVVKPREIIFKPKKCCTICLKDVENRNRLRICLDCREKEKSKTKFIPKSNAQRKLELPEKQTCSTCKKEKHISFFYIDKKRYYLYQSCKACHNKRTRNWTLNHREDVLAYHRQYNKTYVRKR